MRPRVEQRHVQCDLGQYVSRLLTRTPRVYTTHTPTQLGGETIVQGSVGDPSPPSGKFNYQTKKGQAVLCGVRTLIVIINTFVDELMTETAVHKSGAQCHIAAKGPD